MTTLSLSVVHKTRLLYRGDMWAAAFYILSALVLLLLAILLQSLLLSPGFQYLSTSFFMFSAYCLGKGAYLLYTSRKKYLAYLHTERLSEEAIASEISYTQLRIQKKGKSRRVYLWITVCCSLACLAGIFNPLKSIILGTCIPIAMTGGVELGVGLLNEFRLREYLRVLQKSEY